MLKILLCTKFSYAQGLRYLTSKNKEFWCIPHSGGVCLSPLPLLATAVRNGAMIESARENSVMCEMGIGKLNSTL